MRTALLVGAVSPFGVEIAESLRDAGYRVIEDGAEAGAIDVLVVNVPVRRDGTAFSDITDRQLWTAIESSLFEVVAAAQTALPLMPQGGAIIHVASRAHLGAWGGAHLMAAGAALIGMTRSMALELSGDGLRVNAIAADFVGESWDTPAARRLIGDSVVFLASDRAQLINGETIMADSGKSLQMLESRRK